MQLTKNFNLNEFNKHGYSMPDSYKDSYHKLAENLQVIRGFLGSSVIVTSGLRSVEHNTNLDGASKTSQHLFGEACDFVVSGLDAEGLDYVFHKIIQLELVLPNACSQIIRESNGKGAEWIHMGLKTMRWLDVQKAVIADPAVNAAQKAKASKRLTSCECLTTPDTKSFTLVKYIPYGDFG